MTMTKPVVKWHGVSPKKCDICGRPITKTFVDGKTNFGSWGCLCLPCHADCGISLGLGRGQKYQLKDGDWVKAGG